MILKRRRSIGGLWVSNRMNKHIKKGKINNRGGAPEEKLGVHAAANNPFTQQQIIDNSRRIFSSAVVNLNMFYDKARDGSRIGDRGNYWINLWASHQFLESNKRPRFFGSVFRKRTIVIKASIRKKQLANTACASPIAVCRWVASTSGVVGKRATPIAQIPAIVLTMSSRGA